MATNARCCPSCSHPASSSLLMNLNVTLRSKLRSFLRTRKGFRSVLPISGRCKTSFASAPRWREADQRMWSIIPSTPPPATSIRHLGLQWRKFSFELLLNGGGTHKSRFSDVRAMANAGQFFVTSGPMIVADDKPQSCIQGVTLWKKDFLENLNSTRRRESVKCKYLLCIQICLANSVYWHFFWKVSVAFNFWEFCTILTVLLKKTLSRLRHGPNQVKPSQDGRDKDSCSYPEIRSIRLVTCHFIATSIGEVLPDSLRCVSIWFPNTVKLLTRTSIRTQKANQSFNRCHKPLLKSFYAPQIKQNQGFCLDTQVHAEEKEI